MFGYGYGGGFGRYYNDQRFNDYTGAPTRAGYRSFARKSGAAERREKQGRDAFTKLVNSEETKAILLTPGPHNFDLLTPDIHLTSAAWSDINKWVKCNYGSKEMGEWKL